MIFQDADHALMTATLFHKAVEDYKNKVLEILSTDKQPSSFVEF